MNWKVFIVFHENIYFENYERDELFTSFNYTFTKVGDLANKYDSSILEINKLPNFISLGKHYAEWEAIYNIYKHPELYEELDFIGFSHYDKQHKVHLQEIYNITELIQTNLSNDLHISFETHPFKGDVAQNIMMDINRPNELTGTGKNCYLGIIEDYNQFFGTNYTIYDAAEREFINLVSCFLLPIKHFKNIMRFIASIIESGKLNQFDTLRQHRLQGGLLERYMGIALMFEDIEHLDITIKHLNQK